MNPLALATVLGLALGAEPIKPKPLDVKIEKIKAPELTVPDLGGVPKAEGLKKEEAEKAPEAKQTLPSEGVKRGPVAVEKVVHAQDFVARGVDRLPKGQISEFRMYAVPAKILPFKTCLTLNSPDGVTKPVMVALRSPSGETLLANRGEVVFGGPGKLDFVIDWAAFEARYQGEYKVTVQIGLQPAQDFPLVIKVGK